MLDVIPTLKDINVTFVPVTINYEYVPTSEILPKDLLEDDTVFNASKLVKLMTTNCGKCFVEFSEPIQINKNSLNLLSGIKDTLYHQIESNIRISVCSMICTLILNSKLSQEEIITQRL